MQSFGKHIEPARGKRKPVLCDKETRILLIPPALIELLKSFTPGVPDSVIFPRADGRPHVEAPHAFRAVVDALGLNDGLGARDRVSFHTIRHTVASQLAKTLDVRSLMDVMGWKVVAMAARYIHSNEDAKRAAMAALEKTLAPQTRQRLSHSKAIPLHRESLPQEGP